MIALKITDLKKFMTELLGGRLFDEFMLGEGSVTTFCTMTISGNFRPEFFSDKTSDAPKAGSTKQTFADTTAAAPTSGSSSDRAEKKASLVRWKQVKPFFFSFIKGKRMPLSFRFVFYYPEEQTNQYLVAHNYHPSADDRIRLCLNLRFDGKGLNLTTGVSHSVFSLDKTCDHVWDDGVRGFLKSSTIDFE